MNKIKKTEPAIHIESDMNDFIPTQMQIDTLARRLMPEIKKYFADEEIQREFAEWQEKHSTAKEK